jgi:hypothetical protein
MVGRDHWLFHNHVGNQVHYHYPRIQYRVWRGQAGLLALGAGVDSLMQAMTERDWQLNWQGQSHPLYLTHSEREGCIPALQAQSQRYRLHRWIALNQPQFARWQACQGLRERIELLEARLSQQLQRLVQDLGYALPAPPQVALEDLSATHRVRLHRNPMLAFDLVYRSNLALPNDLAIGKGAAHGFGWQEVI